jgi:hypothetical protein
MSVYVASEQLPSPPCSSGPLRGGKNRTERVRGIISDFSLTLSLSLRERERKWIASTTCSEVSQQHEYDSEPYNQNALGALGNFGG